MVVTAPAPAAGIVTALAAGVVGAHGPGLPVDPDVVPPTAPLDPHVPLPPAVLELPLGAHDAATPDPAERDPLRVVRGHTAVSR